MLNNSRQNHAKGCTTPARLFEENYQCLLNFLPAISDYAEGYCYQQKPTEFCLQVLSQHKYTWELLLTSQLGNGTLAKESFNASWKDFEQLEMHIRMYHDAQVAEVIHHQGSIRLASAMMYSKSLSKMCHRDEKKQSNLLLAEILQYFLQCLIVQKLPVLQD